MSSVIAEQKIQGLEHWTREQIKKAVRDYIEDIVSTNEFDFRIVDMEIVGSRTRGTATPESDLDVVVQYAGELKEDRAQDIFNYERLRLDSIEVDILSTREPLKKWLERHKGYVKMHYDDVPFPEVIEEIKKVPDVNDPRRINYWVQKGDKWIYIEGWCDKCLLGTGFPPMEKGGTFEKVMYMEDMTLKILEAKAKERGLKLLRGGFVETPDKTYLYGVTWGVFEAPTQHTVSEPVAKQMTFGGKPIRIRSPMEKLLIEFLENDPIPPSSSALLGKLQKGEELTQIEWIMIEHALLLPIWDTPKWRPLREHYKKLGKFVLESATKPAMQKLITINYTDYRGAGVSKTLPPDHAVIQRALNEMRREATLRIDGKTIGKVEYLGRGAGLPHGRRWNWWYDTEEVDKLAKESGKTRNKTVYIAGMPEAMKDNRARMQELENMLKEGRYEVTGRQGDIMGLPYLEYKAYTEDDLKNVAEWFKKNISELSFEFKYENIDKFKKQITEMLRPTVEDRDRIELIIEELKEGKPPYAIFVDKTDNFILEGRHRIVAFYLHGLKNIPVYYVSLKVGHEATKDNKIQQKEPWQMTREEFAKTAVPLPDRKDFIKAWLKDNENIPNLVKPGFNYIEQRNGSLLVFGNQRGQAIGIISFRKDAVEHIAVSDRYKGRGIATQLLEESRKYGVRRIIGAISPEAIGIAHRFMVRTAFMEGKPIPPMVLREYPDLMAKVEKQRWRRA